MARFIEVYLPERTVLEGLDFFLDSGSGSSRFMAQRDESICSDNPGLRVYLELSEDDEATDLMCLENELSKEGVEYELGRFLEIEFKL